MCCLRVCHSLTRTVMRLALLVSVITTAFAFAAAQNLITNGSFEMPRIVSPEQARPFWSSTTPGIPGWRVTAGSVEVVATNWSPHYDGSQSLDLNGWQPGEMAQDVSIPAPGQYLLRFAMSANTYRIPNEVRSMLVKLGNLYTGSFTFDPTTHPGHALNNMKWDVHCVAIGVPTAGTYTLSFTSTFTTGYGYDTGPVIDAVSLTPVPEPTTAVLFGTGLASVLALRRRKR